MKICLITIRWRTFFALAFHLMKLYLHFLTSVFTNIFLQRRYKVEWYKQIYSRAFWCCRLFWLKLFLNNKCRNGSLVFELFWIHFNIFSYTVSIKKQSKLLKHSACSDLQEFWCDLNVSCPNEWGWTARIVIARQKQDCLVFLQKKI
jgi:hypothetical protein